MTDPTECVDSQTIAAALKYVNGLRATAHLQLLAFMPSGQPQKPRDCPVYHALKDVWPGCNLDVHRSDIEYTTSNGWRMLANPIGVQNFIRQFDEQEPIVPLL